MLIVRQRVVSYTLSVLPLLFFQHTNNASNDTEYFFERRFHICMRYSLSRVRDMYLNMILIFVATMKNSVSPSLSPFLLSHFRRSFIKMHETFEGKRNENDFFSLFLIYLYSNKFIEKTYTCGIRCEHQRVATIYE